jgi:sugar lactone lactonase YvrE
MVAAPDGTIFVSGGFHVGSVFSVSPSGVVTTLASRLADPQGIALDGRGNLYVAESSFHRIVRLRLSDG